MRSFLRLFILLGLVVAQAAFVQTASAQAPAAHRAATTELGDYDDPRFLAILENPLLDQFRMDYLNSLRTMRELDCDTITDWQIIPTDSGIRNNRYNFVPWGAETMALTFPEDEAGAVQAAWIETYQVNFCGEVSIERAAWMGWTGTAPMAYMWMPPGASQLEVAHVLRGNEQIQTLSSWHANRLAGAACSATWDSRAAVRDVSIVQPLSPDGEWQERWHTVHCEQDVYLRMHHYPLGNGLFGLAFMLDPEMHAQ